MKVCVFLSLRGNVCCLAMQRWRLNTKGINMEITLQAVT